MMDSTFTTIIARHNGIGKEDVEQADEFKVLL
jgi:hypothetical protein